jgi:hypothetical protein
MIYELWYLEGGSIIDAWDTEEEALALVRNSVEAYGPAYVESWALLGNDPDEEIAQIAKGTALAEFATSHLKGSVLGD